MRTRRELMWRLRLRSRRLTKEQHDPAETLRLENEIARLQNRHSTIEADSRRRFCSGFPPGPGSLPF